MGRAWCTSGFALFGMQPIEGHTMLACLTALPQDYDETLSKRVMGAI